MTQPTMPPGTPGGPHRPCSWPLNVEAREQPIGWTPPEYPPAPLPRLVHPAPITDPALDGSRPIFPAGAPRLF